MTRRLAFIKLDALFLVFHRFQKELRLFLAHLSLLLRFGLGELRGLLRRLRLLVTIRSFDFTGQFFLR